MAVEFDGLGEFFRDFCFMSFNGGLWVRVISTLVASVNVQIGRQIE